MRSLFILGFSLITLTANQLSALAQTRQPTNAEIKRLRQELQQHIRLTKNNSTGASYLQDRRTQVEKNTRESFVSAWSKTEPRSAPFFGIWGGYETARHIYPSNIKGRVCVVKTGEGYGSVATGIFSNGVIKTNVGEVLFKEGSYYLGSALLKNGQFVSNDGEIPLHSPSPLEPLNKLLNYIFEPSEKSKVAQQFNAAGCTNLKPGEKPNIAVNSSNYSSNQEKYIDDKCQQNQQLSQSDLFSIFYKSDFQTKGQTYWFYSGRYQDGAAIFCISQPGFKQPRPLNELKPIQSNFIHKVTKDPRNTTAFIVVTREGNGSYVPMNEYRLNFANVNQPTLTKLRTWKSKD